MAKDKSKIVLGIRNFVANSRESCNRCDWYVGITANPGQRLFDEHKVEKVRSDQWICFEAINEQAARDAEVELLGLGYDGGDGGGDHPTYVYAFLKVVGTRR